MKMTPKSTMSGTRPNILFILADDLSYRDLSCFGQVQFETPNLDRLCQTGLRFDNAYCGSPECAPSRGSLMTGLHMGHCRIRKNDSARGQDHLLASDLTIAEVLKKAGYTTGMVGKWGIGLPDTEGTPDKKGFDLAFGFYDQGRAHTYYPHYLYHNSEPIPIPENYGFDMETTYQHTRTPAGLHVYDDEGQLIPHGVADPKRAKNSEDLCYQKAIDFIDQHHQQPFFLYYATQLPHGPCITSNLGQFKDRPWLQKHKEWASMITHLDRHVGGLLDRLRQYEIFDNTLIIFASDNGYAHWGYMGRQKYADDPLFRNKGPWRGGKFIAWEGGVRVPMFVHWSGRISAGVSYHTVTLYDFFDTACDLAGVRNPPITDGISFLPTLENREADQQKHDHLYWENGGHATHAQAVCLDQWFAYRQHPNQPAQLWDTKNDVGGEHDVGAEHPDIVQRVLDVFDLEHQDSQWYLNPGESEESFQSKSQRAAELGEFQEGVRANTEYRGEAKSMEKIEVVVDPTIPD